MKQSETPQDDSALHNFTNELCYVLNDDGSYSKVLSKGWEVKASALNVVWDDIEEKIKNAQASIQRGEASPILFFMELNLMDIGIVSAYTGLWKWQVKRHLQQKHFKKLSSKVLQKYAKLFDVTLDELITMTKK